MSNHPHSRPTIPPPGELAKLPADGGPEWNRLVFEQSPYLLQHAANPVDWFPWGDEAFERARQLDKPVFLSIGYATCHWCHVMERESFEVEAIARLMNDAFVCIKVDREERPDIDHVYMTVTQMLTGQGGWPMTVVMTPDRRPFFAGTYFPPESRYGRPGMRDLIVHLSRVWKDDRESAVDASDRIAEELGRMAKGAPGDALDAKVFDAAFDQFDERFDTVRGGFGERPKFPVPHNLSYLLRHHHRTGNKTALAMAELTLERMSLGGIFDQVGFGFHRYSTDAVWLVPHFEKMLYDQALLAIAYVEAYQVTGKPVYGNTAREVLEYIRRDMTSPEGGFYCAEDADSEGEEGKFYVWTREELLAVLGNEEGAFFADLFGCLEDGNFHDESTGEQTGANIPHLRRLSDAEPHRERIETARQKLFAVREARIHPLKDDKILTDWNGLMIAALAKASTALDEPSYKHSARRAADFMLERLRTPGGRLLKRYRLGNAGLPAHLEDYAFLAWGLVELYQATFEARYLKEAIALADTMIHHFHDAEGGGFFQTADDGEALLAKAKECYDGAIPSGNSVAALMLVKLARLTGNSRFEDIAAGTVRAFSAVIAKAPSQFSFMLMAHDFLLGPSSEIVLAGDDVAELAQVVRSRFLPRAVVLHKPDGDSSAVVAIAPFAGGMKSGASGPRAYVCRNHACQAPVSTPAELSALLDAIR